MSFICTETLDFAVFFYLKKNNNRAAQRGVVCVERERERDRRL